MGLTNKSTGINASETKLVIKKQSRNDKVVAIAGNPNVGKSTVFNGLTGLYQHTGNWPGKTVTNAQGYCRGKENSYVLVDIPGTYSLLAHSAEEEVARNFICFEHPDVIVVVCDATCLERNLNLVIQTIEIHTNVIVCVNLLDEAKKKGIDIDLEQLSSCLGVPVIGITARKKTDLHKVIDSLDQAIDRPVNYKSLKIAYSDILLQAIRIVEEVLQKKVTTSLSYQWLSLRLIENDPSLMIEMSNQLGLDYDDQELKEAIDQANELLAQHDINKDNLQDKIVVSFIHSAHLICQKVVHYQKQDYNQRDRQIDKILTNRWTGYPIMILLLALIFWITITGANYPSQWLSDFLFGLEVPFNQFFHFIGTPLWLSDMLVSGVYRVLAWVVSVMLPPMAIFFPLFTLMEDLGYLPRIAFNLDHAFKKCSACGKQALTMCMGFGCNAAGIVGCRIIDSPRERLIAMITNNFVPCNGRFPTLIAILTMFFIGTEATMQNSLLSAIFLTMLIVLGITMTLIISKLLSKTILKGVPSSFTLELPPYRKPQVGKVIVRSIFDRTLFVLSRAVAVAAPAGLIIWLMANISVDGMTILNITSNFLDPFAKCIGLDGVILLAFILGFPANEIVIPIMIMAYLASGSLIEMDNLVMLKSLLVENGWTWITAINVMLFSLMHWPCSTTLLTIKKEANSWKWAIVSFLVPAVTGIIICSIFTMCANLFI